MDLSRLCRWFAGVALTASCHALSQPVTTVAATTSTPAKPPVTPLGTASDPYHGLRVADPYRWLETSDDPAVSAWTVAQNQFTRAQLDLMAARSVVAERVSQVLRANHPRYFGLVSTGSTWIVHANLPPKQQAVLLSMPAGGSTAEAKVLLDPTQLDPSGKTHIDWAVPSPDGSLLAVSLSRAGTERGDLNLIDTATGVFLPDRISHVNGGTAGGDLAWAPNGQGFYYTRYPRPGERSPQEEDFYQQVYFHEVGADAAEDRYELGRELPKIAENRLEVDGPTGRVLLTVQDGDGGEFAHYLRSPAGHWKQLSTFGDKLVQMVFIPGSEDLLAISRKNALAGELLRVDGRTLDVSTARQVVPPSSDTLVSDFWGDGSLLATPAAIYATYQLGGPSEVRVFSYEGNPLPWSVPQKVAGVSGLSRDGASGVLVRTEGYLVPPRWYRHDEQTSSAELTSLVSHSPFGSSTHRVLREFATSADGTPVPMTILLPQGIAPGSAGPCVVTGYGGYGVSLKPRFRSQTGLWLEQGVTYIVANLRGGGEYGEAWHRAGNLLNKQNVFDDFAAVLRHAVSAGYAAKDRLGIIGGSNGGLLMGATMVQNPTLPKAVVSFVGLYDMLRVELSPNGAFNVTEFGTVQDPEQFRALYAYSPYHHVRAETRYPRALFLTGENDPRVDPMHSRKMVARLQAAAINHSDILLRTSADAGHGSGNDLDERIAQSTDVYAFMFDALGVQPHSMTSQQE